MPGVAERVYNFKAPANLADRLALLGAAMPALSEEDEVMLAEELAARLLSQADRFEAWQGNQSALIRGALLVLIDTVEKFESDRQYASEYAALARGRSSEDRAFTRAALASAAALWHNDE